MRFLLLTVLSLTTLYLSGTWYVCYIKKECTDSLGRVTKILPKAQASQPQSLKIQKDGYQEKFEILNGNIHFHLGAREPLKSKQVRTHLRKIVNQWKKNSGKLIYVSGHTDNKGPIKSNYKLGLLRAKIIRDGLVAQGIKKSKIKISSHGELKPIGSNRTREGQFLNRRVEIIIK